jgi:predicted nucleic acid-binding protein
MTTYLPDINLLLALSDPMHIHHQAAHRWFAETGQTAWATRPITEIVTDFML